MSDRAADDPPGDDSDDEAAAEPVSELDAGGDAVSEPTDEWRYSLEDLEAREIEQQAAEAAARERQQPVEAGEPTLEGTVFVLLGVFAAAFILSRLFI